jgi:hypothetical protein
MPRYLLIILFVSLMAITAGTATNAAWDPPLANPPDGNTYKPINQGDQMQVKSGTLRLGGDNYTANPGDWSFLVEKGQVGIGTTDPSSLLDLSNTVSGQTLFRVSDYEGTEIMRITDSGNIGIASSTPGYNFTVDGYGYFAQPLAVGTPTNDTHATTKSYVDSTLTTEVASSTFWTLSGSDLYPADIAYNVGIGTGAPSYKLDVAGDINLTGTLYQNGSEFQTGYWDQNGSDIYYNTGNVGIGTATPDTLLTLSQKYEKIWLL